ncbi:putative AC transposase, partial [Bienertia sinuspersici]
MFRTLYGRVSLTSDTWIFTFGEPFVCVIIHFSLSLDNTTANTRAIELLKEDTSLSLLLNGSLFHIRCYAHILNLSVQEGITQLQPMLKPIRSVIQWIRVFRTARRAYKTKYCEVLIELYIKSPSNPNSLITNEHWAFATQVIYSKSVKWYSYFDDFPYIYGITAILYPGVKIEESVGVYKGKIVLDPFISSISEKQRTSSSSSSSQAIIVKDIVAIRILTNVSKSAFSAGRRVLAEKRSHLAPKIIEMC